MKFIIGDIFHESDLVAQIVTDIDVTNVISKKSFKNKSYGETCINTFPKKRGRPSKSTIKKRELYNIIHNCGYVQSPKKRGRPRKNNNVFDLAKVMNPNKKYLTIKSSELHSISKFPLHKVCNNIQSNFQNPKNRGRPRKNNNLCKLTKVMKPNKKYLHRRYSGVRTFSKSLKGNNNSNIRLNSHYSENEIDKRCISKSNDLSSDEQTFLNVSVSKKTYIDISGVIKSENKYVSKSHVIDEPKGNNNFPKKRGRPKKLPDYNCQGIIKQEPKEIIKNNKKQSYSKYKLHSAKRGRPPKSSLKLNNEISLTNNNNNISNGNSLTNTAVDIKLKKKKIYVNTFSLNQSKVFKGEKIKNKRDIKKNILTKQITTKYKQKNIINNDKVQKDIKKQKCINNTFKKKLKKEDYKRTCLESTNKNNFLKKIDNPSNTNKITKKSIIKFRNEKLFGTTKKDIVMNRNPLKKYENINKKPQYKMLRNRNKYKPVYKLTRKYISKKARRIIKESNACRNTMSEEYICSDNSANMSKKSTFRLLPETTSKEKPKFVKENEPKKEIKYPLNDKKFNKEIVKANNNFKLQLNHFENKKKRGRPRKIEKKLNRTIDGIDNSINLTNPVYITSQSKSVQTNE